MVDQPLPKPSTPPAPVAPAGAAPLPRPVQAQTQPQAQPRPIQPVAPNPVPAPAPAPVPSPITPPPSGAVQPVAKPPIVPGAPVLPRPPLVGAPAQAAPTPVVPGPAVPGRPAPLPGGMTPPPAAPAVPGGARPVAPQNLATPQSPQAAKAPSSRLKLIPIILGAVLLLGVILFAAFRFLSGGSTPEPSGNGTPNASSAPTRQTVITYWGLWEPNSVLESVFDDFSKQNPGVIVQYQKQSPTQYRERLQAAIASGTGPDLFRFHASWVPMLRSELNPMPNSVMRPADFESTFYPIAAKQLISGNQIVGVPLMYDGLGLYYNKQIFQTAGVQPPTTWAQLSEVAQGLTIRNGTAIDRAGVALGTSTNVEHFSDILGLLMLQNGADPSDPTSNEALQALTFYTNFATKYKVWDTTLPSSTVAFSRGDVAMMIAPSWRAHEVKAMNPGLDFDVVPVPKLANEQIGWASFWAEGVSSQSKNKEAAWQLIKYMSSADVQRKLYSDAKQTRAFGEIYSRVDLASELINEPYVGAYLADAPYAQTWYLNSLTHDNGLNDQIIKYYEDAITAVTSSGRTATQALETVAQGTTLVLRQFGLVSAAPVASPTTAQ